jgi:curved DNA-binding protein CbpA
MKTPDYYAALNLSPDATGREIARAYRLLLRRHHPDMDRNDGGPAADPALLQQVMDAYYVLSDPARRAGYDRSRQQGQANTTERSTARPSTAQAAAATPRRSGSGPIVVVGPVRQEGQQQIPAEAPRGRMVLERWLLDALGYRDRW